MDGCRREHWKTIVIAIGALEAPTARAYLQRTPMHVEVQAMLAEERDLITGLYGRLKAADGGARDGEAEALIASLVVQQPAATYLLTQTVLVQEQALQGAAARIAELEAKLAAPAPAAPAAATSFLAGAPRLGPWGARRSLDAPVPMASERPPQQTAQPMGRPSSQAGSQAGGFLRSALTTAAGVAGGALLFEGVRSMLGHSGGPFGSAAAAQPSSAAATAVERPETASDNHAPSPDASAVAGYDDDAGADDVDFADLGSDDGLV